MVIVIDAKEGSKFRSARRITEMIGVHGKEMTHDAIDRAVNLWDSLLKSSLNNQTTEEEVMEKSRKDALMERGKAFVRLGFKPRQAAQMALEIERKVSTKQLGATAPTAKVMQPEPQPKKHLRWGCQPGAWGNDRLMVENSATVMPQAPQVATKQAPQSPGAAFSGYEKKRDVSKLTGHQQAALKAGVDIDKVPAANLERMDVGQMQGLASEQQLVKLKEQRAFQALRDHPAPWGTMPGLGRRR